jgi:branched-chain amino acid transport system substrate-binding protein
MGTYLRSAGRQDVSLTGTEIGSGSGLVWQRVEALLQGERPDLLVGIVSPNVAASLSPLLEASRRLLVSATLGENVPRAAERNASIFYHTLGLWQSNWALGRWAASNLGSRALVASAFWDSGYDALYAFQMGFEGAGGEIVATEITHRPEDRDGVSRVIASTRETRPDFVFASHYGQNAVELLTAYYQSGLSGVVPLAGTAYLTDTPVLAATGSAALGVRTGFAWSLALSTPENAAFIRAHESETGTLPDGLALLGYETACLVFEALDRAGGKGDSLNEALSSARFAGPRGDVAMDGLTHSTSGPLYLREVRLEGGALANAVAGELSSSAEQDPEVSALISTEKTGWLNPYLCD